MLKYRLNRIDWLSFIPKLFQLRVIQSNICTLKDDEEEVWTETLLWIRSISLENSTRVSLSHYSFNGGCIEIIYETGV